MRHSRASALSLRKPQPAAIGTLPCRLRLRTLAFRVRRLGWSTPVSLLFVLASARLFTVQLPQSRAVASGTMVSLRRLGLLSLCLSVLPASGARGDGSARGAYTLNLHPPEESAADVKASLDAIMAAEKAKLHEEEEAFSGEKARMLAVEKAELAQIVREAFQPLLEAAAAAGAAAASNHSVVGPLRPSSFLSSEREPSAQSAGYVLQLHPPEEDTADVKASLDAVMQAEKATLREADEAFSAEKARMLAAEKAEITLIVREALAPLVDALGLRRSSKRGGPRQASFLSSGVLPIDPAHIRKGIDLTQPLRAPPQAAVNVVEREDTAAMEERAKYVGMIDQTKRVMADFHYDLELLGQRAA